MAGERENTMAGLIRQGLAADATAPGACPGPDILAAYYERALDRKEMSGCELHLSRCARCREQLAMMAHAAPQPSAELRHSWLWDWRLLTAAVAALVVLTIWGLRRPAFAPFGSRNANEPLVAMSRPGQAPPPETQQPPAQPTRPPSLVAPSGAPEAARSRQLDRLSPPVAPPAASPKGAESAAPLALKKQAPGASADINLPAPGAQSSAPELPQAARNQLAQSETSGDHAANGRDSQALALQSQQGPSGQAAKSAPAPNRIAPNTADEKALARQAMISPAPKAATQPSAPPAAGGVLGGMIGSGPAPNPSSDSAMRARSLSAGAGAPGQPGAAGPAGTGGTASSGLAAGAAAALPQLSENRYAQTIIRTPDPKILWRIAGGGFVERSEDGGASWHGQLPEANARVTTGAAPSAKACWLVGENGLILVTKDTVHWKKIPPPIPANFVSIDAKSASAATVTADGGQKFSTSDGGKRWVPAR